jgi:hypothetical protein
VDHESVDCPSHQTAGEQPANGDPNERKLVTFRQFFFPTRRKKLIHLLPAYRLARAALLISIKTLAPPCNNEVSGIFGRKIRVFIRQIFYPGSAGRNGIWIVSFGKSTDTDGLHQSSPLNSC